MNPVGKLNVIHPNSAWTGAVDPDGLLVTSAANSNKRLSLTYDPTTDIGYISAVEVTVGWKNLVLQAQGGNVGIGTTSPAGALDVRNSGNSGVRMADANGNVIEGILGGALGTLWLNYTSTGNVLLAHGGGNVGIGTGSPGARLHVNSDNVQLFLAADNNAFPYGLFIRKNKATETVYEYNGPNYAQIIQFDNAPLIFGTNNLERVRIDSAGNVGIGTTSPLEKLQVAGAIRSTSNAADFSSVDSMNIDYYPAGKMGRINAWNSTHDASIYIYTFGGYLKLDYAGNVSGTYGSYHSSSDIRRKKDIVTISNALNKVLALRGVNFKWKDPSQDTNLHMGMIAQEVEKVVPEVVHTADDKMRTKAIEYQYMVGLLVEAIKDQQKQIEELKGEIRRYILEIKETGR